MGTYEWHTCHCPSNRDPDPPYPDRCIFDEPRDSLEMYITRVRNTISGDYGVLTELNDGPYSTVVYVDWGSGAELQNGHYVSLA